MVKIMYLKIYCVLIIGYLLYTKFDRNLVIRLMRRASPYKAVFFHHIPSVYQKVLGF
jgi:hypothetical protein